MRPMGKTAVVLALCLVPALAFAGAAEQLMEQADALYAKRAEPGMAEKAIEAYQQVLAVDDTVADAYWKIARAMWWTGGHAASTEAAAEIYREGIEFAKLGVAANESSAGAHFWLAVMYGLFGEAKGIMQSLHLVDPMKQELAAARRLDERFDHGGVYRVLGRLYMKLPGFKGGDIEKAIEFGLKSIEIGPDHPMNHLYLGETYVQAGKKDEARTHLQRVIDMPTPSGLAPEHPDWKTQARALLSGL